MNKEHEQEIIMTLTPYLLAFPQSKMTAEGLVIYAKALSSLSIAEINAAMLKLMRTCKFFPTVAEIFEQATVMKDFASGKEIPSPDEAWAEVQSEVRRKHLYREWEYSCPEVKAAAEHFGKFEVNTARAQFMRIYKAIVDRARDKKANWQVMKSLSQSQAKALVDKVAEKLAMPVEMKTAAV